MNNDQALRQLQQQSYAEFQRYVEAAKKALNGHEFMNHTAWPLCPICNAYVDGQSTPAKK